MPKDYKSNMHIFLNCCAIMIFVITATVVGIIILIGQLAWEVTTK